MRFAGKIARSIVWIAGLGALLAPRGATADAIDDLLAEAPIPAPMKRGQAIGQIVGREGDFLLLKNGSAEFKLPLSALVDAEKLYAEAKRLAGEGWHRRAAVQLGFARLIDPDNPLNAELTDQVLKGMGAEVEKIEQFREDREQSMAAERIREAKAELAKKFPRLCEMAANANSYLPRPSMGALPDLRSWIETESMPPGSGMGIGRLMAIRSANVGPEERIATLRGIRASMPPIKDIAQAAGGEKAIGKTAAVQIYFHCLYGLWMDCLEFELYRDVHRQERASFREPIDLAKEKAREILREKYLPSYRIAKESVGNLEREIKVPVRYDRETREKMEPRINSPFLQEKRRSDGMFFITEMGDEALVPIDNWEAFDNPQRPSESPEDDYLKRERANLEQFVKAFDEATLIWAGQQDNEHLLKAFELLNAEIDALYEKEPRQAK